MVCCGLRPLRKVDFADPIPYLNNQFIPEPIGLSYLSSIMKKKTHLLSLIFFLFFQINSVVAAKYYFSTTSGNDSRSPTQAQNPNTPWKSISKLNSIFHSLKPGDEILFKRGDVFYGTINISRSGTSSSPIVIGSYGTGAKPVITSLITLKNWKSIGNGIYESADKSLNKEVNVVLINNKIQELGRYPNSDAPNGGYLTITSHSGNNSVSSSELSSSSNFSGGEVVIRKNQWIIDRHRISSHSGNKINYIPSGSYRPSNGYGMFVQGHIKTLDKTGEWYYDGSNKKLSVYLGSSNPSSSEIQASSLDYLLSKTYHASHLRIENLHFNGANKDAIHLAGGNDIQIRNVEIENSGENGMTLMSVLNLVIDNSRVVNSLNNGIALQYGNLGARVTNNVVENTFIFQGGARNSDKNGIGILVTSNNSVIEYNKIINTGFNGITFEGNGTLIKNNLIDNYCFFKNDGGGIYSYGGTGLLTVFKNRKVVGNIILNGQGSKDGTPLSNTSTAQSSGIFLDDNSNGVEIINNTIAHSVYSGIKIANSSNISVNNNTFYNSNHQVLIGNGGRGRNTRNINVTNNILFSKHSDQYAYTFRSDHNDISSFGKFDQNFFARPFGDNHLISLSYKKGNKKVDDFLNLKRWQNSFNKDNSSNNLSKTVKAFEVEKLIGKSRFHNGTFDRNVNDIYCGECKSSWVSGKLDGGAIKVESPASSSLRFEMGSVKKNKNYILKFKGVSNKSGGLRVYLRHGGTPWETVSPSTTVELNTTAEEYTVLLRPYEDVERTAVMLVSDEGNWTYWLDNIEVREAEVALINPKEKILFEYNPTKTEKTIPLNGTYVDANNQTYSGKITLAPFSSIVLMNTSDKTVEAPSVAPKIEITSPDSKAEYVEGASITVKAVASATNSQITKVEFFNNGELFGSSASSPYSYVWKDIPLGSHTITAVATDGNNLRTTSKGIQVDVKSKPAVEVPDPVEKPTPIQDDNQDGDSPQSGVGVPVYVNTGSDKTVVFEGASFKPIVDTPASASNYTVSSYKSNSVNELFQTSSYAKNLIYSVPVPDGKYTVKTYHSENYFGGAGPSAEVGQRVFDIIIEGELMKDDFDMYTKSGNSEVVLTFENVEVKDGKLEIELVASANNAVISGFAILPSSDEPPSGANLEDAIFINAGSLFDVIYEDDRFVSDYRIGSFSKSDMNTDITSSDDPLFQSYRFAKDLSYAVPVSNGLYTVITYHFENYFGKNGPAAREGRRVFNISIEDKAVKTGFDMFVENNNEETVLIFEGIQVKDGVLNLDLAATSNNAVISGIAIIPMDLAMAKIAQENNDFSLLINTGSYEDVEHEGKSYKSEFSNKYLAEKSIIAENINASPDPLYQTYRYGKNLRYEIPVTNGTYSVVTHHHETFFGHSNSGAGPNRRVFDVLLEGNVVKKGLDLFKENSNRPVTLKFDEVVVTDGILNLDMIASRDNAIISGFEIWGVSGKTVQEGANLRIFNTDSLEAVEEGENVSLAGGSSIKLYPNPAKSEVSLAVNQEVGDFAILIHNMNGQLASNYDSNILQSRNGEFIIPIHHLQKGVYLVTLAGKAEIIKRMRLIVAE